MELISKAYAKVNLHLQVLNRRIDGFHNIFSLNANIDIFDLLKLNIIDIFTNPNLEGLIKIIPDGGRHENVIHSISEKENLISRSVELYLNRIGRKGRISVSIEKNIPAGAGFGGGSSDAAAILRLLNDYFQGIDESDLLKIGLELGADVPYCLTGGFAICEGIGEKIEKIQGGLSNSVLFVNTGIHVDTRSAYLALGRTHKLPYNKEKLDDKRLIILEGIRNYNLDYIKPVLLNDFEKPVFEKYPEIRVIKEEIMSNNPDYVTMTGSGSSLIALFRDYHKAELSERSLRKIGREACITKFC
ncbi:MAG: 4-(cytidine 5'-diphospho)-2-C-methyl-D-erythritol kinase [Spirochaetota bacterium]|nr:4-(cytidine 5'-diphospho)-2-C-methyl-D-erythritol kinase [Spirochaetota bacterium]